MRHRRRLTLGLVLWMSLAACTAPTSDPPPATTSSGAASPGTRVPAPSRSSTPTPTPTPRPTPTPGRTVPLVLAVHHSRSIGDVSSTAANSMLTDGAARWSTLGQEGGGLRIVGSRVESLARATTIERLDRPEDVLALVRSDDSVLGLVPADTIDETVRVLTVGGIHPLRTPDNYELQLPATTEPPDVTTLTVVGDIMLGRRVGRSLVDRPDAAFRPFAKRLAAADITVGNFEATLSDDGTPTQGGDSFAADPATLAGLRLAGFDAVSLANNHVGDYGRKAMELTFTRFADAEIETFGAGPDLAAARAPLVITRGSTTVGLIGTESIGETPAAGASTPGTNRLDMPPRTGPLDVRTLDRIAADIEDLAQRVDTVVVVPHWGTQYTNVPEASQRRVARRFAEAGADLVIGGHPHWVQGWETFGSTLAVHSLGNFIFDMDFSRQTQEGLFVEIVLWDGKVLAAEPVPYVIGSDFTPRPAGERRTMLIMDLLRETSRGPYAKP